MIRLRPNRTPHSLDDWLSAATRDLCFEAKERVSEEMSEHFYNARAAHMDAGCAEADASALALRELGNPRRERRRLLREHFTIGEAVFILGSANEYFEPKPLSWKHGVVFGVLCWSWLYFMLFQESAAKFFPFGPTIGFLASILMSVLVTRGFYGARRDAIQQARLRVQEGFDLDQARSRIRGTGKLAAGAVAVGLIACFLFSLPLPVDRPVADYLLFLNGLVAIAWGLSVSRTWRRQIRILETRYAGKEVR